MLSASVLLTALFAASTLTAPALKPTPSIQKRTPPRIASGFTAQQTTQITDAFRDALELSSYVLVTSSPVVDPIFAKYFNPADHDLVNGECLLASRAKAKLLIGCRGLQHYSWR